MIDVTTETLITLPQAAARLPGRPSLCALWRWRTKGVCGRKLESVTIGGTPYTSVEALARFAKHEGEQEQPKVRTMRQRERAMDRAERELREAGV